MTDRPDTICAIATPIGTGGIAVIRVSGPGALPTLDRLFQGTRPSRQRPRTVRLGWIREGTTAVDQVLLTVFRAPRSYTGEDVAELSCHGGIVAAERVLRLLLRAGCRLAGPGEFTRRAVLNGRLTLAQAEAVGDIASARTASAHRAAVARYQNGHYRLLEQTRVALDRLLADVEYLLGFETEDPRRPVAIRQRLAREAHRLGQEVARAERSRFLHDGANVVIVGRPNAGKSSLFNRLVEAERALVSPVPGTTRDTIEATIEVAGVPVRLSDTCGIASRGDRLTRLAQIRSDDALSRADLVLAVFDGCRPAGHADRAVVAKTASAATIYVINKNDRPCRFDSSFLGRRSVSISCRTGRGIAGLRRRIRTRLLSGHSTTSCGRHEAEALRACWQALRQATRAPNLELLGVELKAARETLASPADPVRAGAVLDRILADFCVGK